MNCKHVNYECVWFVGKEGLPGPIGLSGKPGEPGSPGLQGFPGDRGKL